MSESIHCQPEDRPRINSTFVFRWEKSQDTFVLLYPEGIVKLSASASEILKRCTGESSVAEIVAELKGLFVDAPDIENSIYRFLEVSHVKGWIGN
jgi:pyrroloquinoline quinone biosynthesis protein D